jgi:Na+/H+ antiporter NhaC
MERNLFGDTRYTVTVTREFMNEHSDLKEENEDLRDQLEELSAYPWGTLLWGIFIGMVLTGIPYFLTLRHFNLLP